jgi:glycosyltransferase involved in cell wall biosynthesis
LASISVVIIARNEGHQLGRCLKRVQNLADELLVGDSGSTDNTVAVALAHGARVLELEWKGFAATKNELNAHATGDYILSLDADEVPDDILLDAMLKLKPQLSRAAYSLDRLAFVGERPIRYGGWYPDLKVRLFPNGKARWVGDFVHERLELDADISIERLPGRLLHYSFRDLHDLIERSNRYSTLAAQGIVAQGKRLPPGKRWLSPAWRFIKFYVLKQGFRDGFLGGAVAWISCWEAWCRYTKVKEARLHGLTQQRRSTG